MLGIAGRRGQRPGRARRGHHGHARAHVRASSSSATSTSPTGHVREIREAGVGYIPEDRHRHGLLLEAPLWENRILGHQTEAPNVRAVSSSTPPAAKADTERIVKEYDVRTPSIFVTAGSLSGGNQQKLIIGREMSHQPKVLVAAHPTRGVDVGAQASIWDHIRGARRDGLAVLLISADLEELIGLSDTIRGDPARQALRRVRPGHGDRRGPRRGHDRRAAETMPRHRRRRMRPPIETRVGSPDVSLGVAAPLLAIVVRVRRDLADPARRRRPGRRRCGQQLIDVPLPRQVVAIINAATVYYLSAIAVAIGFRMNLFNIGVDGQYRVAAFAAAVFAGQAWLPGLAATSSSRSSWPWSPAACGPASRPTSR